MCIHVFQPWQSKSGGCCRVSLRAASTELKGCKQRDDIFYSGRINGFPTTYVFADCVD